VASRAPAKRLNPKVLEYARALVEYAEGGRAEPPKAEGTVPAAELYLALKALGRDPVEVARRARERWERQKAAQRAVAPAGGAPAPTEPAAAGGRLELRVGAGRSAEVLLPGGGGWVPVRDAVEKRVRWLSREEGVLELEPGDLPEGAVVRWARWRGREPLEERFFAVRGGRIVEEEVVREEDVDAGEHAGHRIKARVAVTKSGLRIPKFWYVASGVLRGAEGGARASLESLRRWIDEKLAALAPRGAELPDRVKSAILARLPEWADGAYVERARRVALAAPVPEDLRRRVLWAIAETAAEPGGEVAPLKRFFKGRAELLGAMVAPSPPPEELAPLLGVFPAGEGRVGLYYYRLSPEHVAERLAEALDRLAPEWRGMGLHVPDALIDNLGFANALKHLREKLGLRGRTGAELFREAVERLAGWEGAVALAGRGAVVEVVPIKRSRRHEGFYFNDGWQRVRAALPLEEGEDPSRWRNTVVLKTGEAYRAEAVGGGGYAQFNLPPPPRK
jgi:hypothetical protein